VIVLELPTHRQAAPAEESNISWDEEIRTAVGMDKITRGGGGGQIKTPSSHIQDLDEIDKRLKYCPPCKFLKISAHESGVFVVQLYTIYEDNLKV
jgi:hypothetical protein